MTTVIPLAVAACIARFKGSSREHTEPDLRCYLSKPSTVSRRFSVAAGFYRTGVLER